MYMLAAGLVMPPAGFGEKYYRDTLESFPGWIPLFVDRAPATALESSTREARHLKPVIVRIRLSGLSGRSHCRGTRWPAGAAVPQRGRRDRGCAPRTRAAPRPPGSSRSSFGRRTTGGRANGARMTSATCHWGTSSSRRGRRCSRKHPTLTGRPATVPESEPSGLNSRSPPGESWRCCSCSATSATRLVRRAEERSTRLADPFRSLKMARSLIASNPGCAREVRRCQRRRDPKRTGPACRVPARRSCSGGAVSRLVKWREAGRVGSPETVLIDYLAETLENLDPRVRAGIRKLKDTLEITDRPRGRHGQRAVRAARYSPGTRNDLVLPLSRLCRPLRLPQ